MKDLNGLRGKRTICGFFLKPKHIECWTVEQRGHGTRQDRIGLESVLYPKCASGLGSCYDDELNAKTIIKEDIEALIFIDVIPCYRSKPTANGVGQGRHMSPLYSTFNIKDER